MRLLLKCKDEGILTEDKIRKYPLSLSNLQVILKMMAVETFEHYEMQMEKGVATTYYLTDKGLNWFYDFFRNHSFPYCRSLFSHLLIHTNEQEFDPETHKDFSNFRGTDGVHGVAGTKQRAMITRTVGKCVRKYFFDSIKEARDTLKIWLTLYPIEQFTIYRIRNQKGCEFREKIPLIVQYSTDPFKKE